MGFILQLVRAMNRRRSGASRRRPSLDVLEFRQLLSTLVVTTTADDGPGSLRAEVAAAASGDTITFDPLLDGKTILLTSGPVAEVGKSLTIAGPGADELTISGGGKVSIFRFSADPGVFGSSIDVTVSGLTLANGSAPVNGGAIAAQDANLTLSGDAILNNSAGSFGGGVDMGFATNFNTLTLTVTDTRLEGNSSPFGGGIASTGFTSIISGSTFDKNTSSGNFGGAAVLGYGAATVTDSTFTGNSGGGLVFFAGFNPGSDVFHVSGSHFRSNTLTGFGAAIDSFGLLTIDGSDFSDNVASGDGLVFGGAVYSNGDTTIDGSRFDGNRAEGNAPSGGAVHIDGGMTNRITDTTFVGNETNSSVEAEGGALSWGAPGGAAAGRTFAISGVTFEDNHAIGHSDPRGGTYVAGGAVYMQGFDGAMTIEATSFRDNSAIAGDAGQLFAGGSAQGGAVYFTGNGDFGPATTLDLQQTSFAGNSARSGAGNASHAAGEFAEGGALYTAGNMVATITGGTFVGNSAVSGAGGVAPDSIVFALGGALRALIPTSITGTLFVSNSALGSDAISGRDGGSAQGGAIWGAGGTITNALFEGNEAIGGQGGDAVGTGTGGMGGSGVGGAIQTFGVLTVSSSAFLHNDALGGRGGKGRGKGIGGAGGDGIGGGIAFSGATPASSVVLDSLFSLNEAIGGQGGPGKNAGAYGQGLGGGIAVLSGSATIKRTKFLKNRASTAGDDVYGSYTS